MQIQKNIKLAEYTTFHIGGLAKYFVEVKNVNELKEALAFSRKEKIQFFILGGGSNTLFSDSKYNGLVIKISIKDSSFSAEGGPAPGGKNREAHALVSAGAGEIWDTIVAKAVKSNLSGIENLSLIPGTVGGAVYQNIGAYGSELKEVLLSVEVLNVQTNKTEVLSLRACRLGYRDSIFQHPKGKKYIILKAILRLSKKFSPNIKYPDLIEYFPPEADQPLAGKNITLTAVRKAVIKIRKSKLVYPTKNIGTAGSFFKNPIITRTRYKLLIKKYPNIKGRETRLNLIKISAGQLIELAGWKGIRLRNAGVSKRHALVLVNYKNAKAKDIFILAENIKKSVKIKFEIKLEPEVKIIFF